MIAGQPSGSDGSQENRRLLTCQFSYTADRSSELSFSAGEKLTLLDDATALQGQDEQGREWLLVQNGTKRVGKIPRHYVRFEEEVDAVKYPWLLQNATRQQAEQLLVERERGTFLLRGSQHYPGNYTLSLKGTSVEHYLVRCVKGCYTIDDDVFFEDILQLIEHYKRNSDGLCEYLSIPIGSTQKEGNDAVQRPERQAVIDWSLFKDRCLDSSLIQVTSLLGEGEHGKVSVGEMKQASKSRCVAVKAFTKGRAVERFLQEAKMMMRLDCPDIVEFIGATLIDSNPCIVTELMTVGNVLDYLISRGRNVIKPDELISFARGVCQALSYLQKCRIVHRDVAASNVLLSSEHRAKLSDFGLSFSEEDRGVKRNDKIRVKWTAPEALEGQVYSTMSDVWSFGVYLWELYSFGRQPYPRIPNSQVLMWLQRGNRMDIPSNCPPSIGNVMRRCWAVLPTDRPLFVEILGVLQSVISESSLQSEQGCESEAL